MTYESDDELLDQVLQVYKPECRYLRAALVTVEEGLATGRGDFAIPACYYTTIETGHLNAVEFNLCYNQLVYYVIAKSVKEELMPGFGGWRMEDYWHQQRDVLIIDFHSRFRRPIDPRKFSGELKFVKVERRRLREEMILADTTCRFWNSPEGQVVQEGEVKLAIPQPEGLYTRRPDLLPETDLKDA